MDCSNRKDFKFLLKKLKFIFDFIGSGTLLYRMIPIFIMLFFFFKLYCTDLHVNLVYFTCYSYGCPNFFAMQCLYFLMKHITSKMYSAANVKILHSLKICQHDIVLFTPLIIRRTLFCSLKSLSQSLSPPHSIIPYRRHDSKFEKYKFLII
jgi:hypothetical protein